MADSAETAAILARALDYPYATPEGSYLYRDGAALEVPPAGPDLAGRSPLLAYGANAAPEALARKLEPLGAVELPVLQFELAGFDVVYSAHVSPYGAVPATLVESPGTVAPATRSSFSTPKSASSPSRSRAWRRCRRSSSTRTGRRWAR